MENNNELMGLLTFSEFDPMKENQQAFKDYFDKIARILMGNYVIKKGDDKYQIIEIEFYLYTPKHQDVITYPRDMKAGRWFFHSSGVDLTFESRNVEFADDNKKDKIKEGCGEKAIYGGILIRGLKKTTGSKSSKLILGPLKCADELWDDFDAFENASREYPILNPETFVTESTLRCGKRWINIKSEKWEGKLKDWIGRAGIDGLSNKEEYQKAVLGKEDKNNMDDTQTPKPYPYLYRYAFLSDHEYENDSMKKYSARPKIANEMSEKHSFAEMSKVE